jgi:autotransporter-associated beta strand protein
VVNNSASAQYALVGNREPTDSTGDTAPVPAQGNADNDSFILAMLAQARTDVYTPVTPLDYGVTDVRFYGVVTCGGQYGMEIQGIVAPTAPTGLQATPTSSGPVNLAWTAAKGDQVGYNIYRGTTSGGENVTTINGGTPIVTTSYTDATAVAGTIYYYIIEAVNAAGSSGASNECNALTFPGAPTSLGATAVFGAQINLSWTAPSGTVSGYNIYRGTTVGGENYSTPLNGGTLVATTSYNDTTASAGTTYYYTVMAVNASGSSAASGEANALTYPAAPTGLSSTSISTTQINLSWTTTGGIVSGYNVYRGTTPGGESSTPINGALVTTATYNDTTASANTTYYYTVAAVNASGSSAASNEANALTYPAAPTSLNATPISASEIDLAWSDPIVAIIGYNVYRGTSPGDESGSPLNGNTLLTTTTYDDTTVSAGTTYYYTVVAVNASGSSAASNEASGPQTFYWTGGAGVWSAGGGGWLSTGGQAINWSDGNIAVFDGTFGGAVTISGTVNPQEIDFETDGYSLGGGSIVLPSVGGIVRVDADSATIATPISGGALAESGSGSLVVAGSSDYSGGTTVEGTLSVSSAQALPSGGMLVVGRSGRVVLGNSLGGAASIAASSPVAASDATTSSIATTPAEIFASVAVATTYATATSVAVAVQPANRAHDAVFSEPQAATAVAPPSAVASKPTEAVRIAAIAGVVLPSAPLSKPTAVKSLFCLSPKAILVSGISTETRRKIASLIDAVPASPSTSVVATIIAPAPGSYLGHATIVRKARSTAMPRKRPCVLLLARSSDDPSHRGTDESSAGT